MQLYEELRKAREAARLTQSELAKRSGIPRNQIVRAERGENITLDTLRKIVVNLPEVTQLTLLEGVYLTPISVPRQEQVLASAVDTLRLLGGAFLGALNTAINAYKAVEQSPSADAPVSAPVEANAEADPMVIFKRLETLAHQLQTFPKSVVEKEH